jgi:hypothetical protein
MIIKNGALCSSKFQQSPKMKNSIVIRKQVLQEATLFYVPTKYCKLARFLLQKQEETEALL